MAEKVIKDVVADSWALRLSDLCYFPEGGGAYHWIASAVDSRRWFVTCEDLDTKPWLGSDRDSVFDGLLAAYGTAMEMRRAGLAFVVAPVAAVSGARPPNESMSATAFRCSTTSMASQDSGAGQWGPRAGEELVAMLARLHRTTPRVANIAHRDLSVPGRDELEEALADLGRPWDGGPLSEPARRELASHVNEVVRSLSDLLAVCQDRTDAELVVTHGEPHKGNLIPTRTGLVLVDWDTVAMARPERDLWMIADADEGVAAIMPSSGLCGVGRESPCGTRSSCC